MICQHFQSIYLRCIRAAHGSLSRIVFLQHFFGCHRRIHHADFLPVCMFIQKMRRLHQRDPFGVNLFQIGKFCPRKSGKRVGDRDDRLSDNVIFKLFQKIIHLDYGSCRGILDRKNSIIRRSVLDRFHRIPKCMDMETITVFSEIVLHRSLTVSTLRSLKNNTSRLFLQRIHFDERQSSQCPRLNKLPILQFPAHGHQLLIQFLNALFVELPGYL